MMYCFFDASNCLFLFFGKEAFTSSPASCLKHITPFTISNAEHSLKTPLRPSLVIYFNANIMCLSVVHWSSFFRRAVYIYLMWTVHQSQNILVIGGMFWHGYTPYDYVFMLIESDGVWGWLGEMPVSVLNPSTSKWLFTENTNWWRDNLLKIHVQLLPFSSSLARLLTFLVLTFSGKE